MRYSIFIMLFIAPCFLTGQKNWEKFIPENMGFSIMVPGKMEYGLKHVLTDLGELQTTTYLYKGEDKNPDPIFIINITNYPAGVLEPDSTELTEEFFNTSLEGIREKLGGETIYYADISSLYHPRKIYRIQYNQGQAMVKGKMFVSGNRFYSVQAFSSFSNSTLKDIDIFLDSFELTDVR
jgi:hypothetical protein